MHVIEEEDDLVTAEVAGLDVYHTETCDSCEEHVGVIDTGVNFSPFVVLLDDEEEWIICSNCADPVL